MIIFHIILHPAVHRYDVDNFIFILSRVYNEPIQRPVPSPHMTLRALPSQMRLKQEINTI